MNETKLTASSAESLELLISDCLGYWFAFLAVIGVPPNLVVIYLMLTAVELQNVPANILLFTAAIADGAYLLGSAFFNLQWTLYRNMFLCKIGGFFHISLLYGTMVAPLLAMCRFFALNQNSADEKSFKNRLFLTCKGTKTLSLALLIYIIAINFPYIYNDAYGRDPIGACGIAVIDDLYLFAFYVISAVGAVFLSCILTFIYYQKLNTWIVQITGSASFMTRETQGVIRETKNVMKLAKFLTLTPIVLVAPAALGETVFRFYEDLLPKSLLYLFAYPLNITNAVSPIFTLTFVRPFRKEFLKLIRKFKIGRGILRFLKISDQQVQQTRTNAF